MLCNISLNIPIACSLVCFPGMTSSLAKVNKSSGAHFQALFLKCHNFLMILNIQIDLLILKTYYGQFTLTIKKSLRIIFNYHAARMRVWLCEQHLSTLSVPGVLSSCSWEGLSQRLSVAAENFVYFASIRPNYRVRCFISLKNMLLVWGLFDYEHFDDAINMPVERESSMWKISLLHVFSCFCRTWLNGVCPWTRWGSALRLPL